MTQYTPSIVCVLSSATVESCTLRVTSGRNARNEHVFVVAFDMVCAVQMFAERYFTRLFDSFGGLLERDDLIKRSRQLMRRAVLRQKLVNHAQLEVAANKAKALASTARDNSSSSFCSFLIKFVRTCVLTVLFMQRRQRKEKRKQRRNRRNQLDRHRRRQSKEIHRKRKWKL